MANEVRPEATRLIIHAELDDNVDHAKLQQDLNNLLKRHGGKHRVHRMELQRLPKRPTTPTLED